MHSNKRDVCAGWTRFGRTDRRKRQKIKETFEFNLTQEFFDTSELFYNLLLLHVCFYFDVLTGLGVNSVFVPGGFGMFEVDFVWLVGHFALDLTCFGVHVVFIPLVLSSPAGFC